MSTQTYQQASKNEARRSVLRRAVDALTVERSFSAVVSAEEFDEALEYAISFLERHDLSHQSLRPELASHAAEWHALHTAVVGTRAPSDLRVLYLCGPEPLNDLSILLGLGVIPQNIWGIESNAENYRNAVGELKRASQYIRIHHGNLGTFFDATNERFDIVYIDACGALPSGKPNSIQGPLLMFHRERLESIGVLITNFSQPPIEKQSDYERLLCKYFAPRHKDCPHALLLAGADPAIAQADSAYLLPYIRGNFDETYSDFITRFLVDIGREIVPFSRIYDNKDVRGKYFSNSESLRNSIAAATRLPLPKLPEENADAFIARVISQIGDVHLNPGSYPVLHFMESVARDSSLGPMIQSLLAHELERECIKKSFLHVSILSSIIEGHWDAASPEMQGALAQSWSDSAGGIFCDVPLPHLLINSLFGIYGHPYFPNARRSARLSYTAKSTKMYMDMLVLDQCRYYFDYLPTIDLIPSRFQSCAYQLVVRVCLDRMGRQDAKSSSNPFRGAALGSLGEFPSACAYEFLPRVALVPSSASTLQ